MVLKKYKPHFYLLVGFIICIFTTLIIPNGMCKEQHPQSKAAYMRLPELTNHERLQLGVKARKEGEQYVKRANGEIQKFSDKLETYIHEWIEGKAKANLPQGFLPSSIDNEKTHSWRLLRPNEIDPEDQWYAMLAYDPKEELHQFSPDPHATYLKLIFLAPIGAKLIVEGDFPYARFMDYQILTPVDPEHPVTGQMGICEVPIVDVDIEPDPGHVNPFRVGADRSAKKRHYRLTFELKAGNAVDLNPQAMKAPEYRGPGNVRAGGPFAFTGPWGKDVLVPSVLWLRYFAPDKSAGPLGGVSLPKATLQLPSGEKFWLSCDKSQVVKLQTELVPAQSTPPLEPFPFLGPSLGWFKMYGIMRAHAEARAYYTSKPWGKNDPVVAKKRIRQMFSIIFNQGAEASPPGNYENSATECNYISYLIRPMNLGANKVIVLTGKLPKFPRTRNGEKKMTNGQLRYFSITHNAALKGYYGTPYGSLMDDEIIVDKNNKYVIVYSRNEERPTNATTRNGVTWQEWGGPASQTFVLRWLSVMPDWFLPEYSPHGQNIPIEKGAWSEDGYDKRLVGENRSGALGPYHPVIHYMTKKQFEAIGNNQIRPVDLPKWTDSIAYDSSNHDQANTQQKISELKQALKELKRARLNQDRKEAVAAAKKVRGIWDDLPIKTRQMVEDKSPGITMKIQKIPN